MTKAQVHTERQGCRAQCLLVLGKLGAMKRLRRDKPGLNCRLEDRDCATCHLFHCCDRSSLREQEFEVAHSVRGNIGHTARMLGKWSHLKSHFMFSVRKHVCQCPACVLPCLTGCGAPIQGRCPPPPPLVKPLQKPLHKHAQRCSSQESPNPVTER